MVLEPTDDRDERIVRVKNELTDRGKDALVLSKGINQYYLTGFLTAEQKRHLFLFVPAHGNPFYFAPKPYRQDIESNSSVDTVYYWEDTENAVDRLCETVQEVGLDDADEILVNETMWGMYVVDLQRVFDANFTVATNLLMELRTRKSDEELEKIREAAKITDAVSEEIRALDAVGMTENELAAKIEYRMRQHGAGDRGSTQVASGPNSAKPPHIYSDRTIEAGDPVILDFGCSVDGYLSDQSRVVVYDGDPPEGYVDMYESVREAQETGIDAIEPGVKAYEIDEIARGEFPENDNVLVNAPHPLYLATAEEWPFPYSRSKALYPVESLQTHSKFFSPVARVDNAYGDRNLVCTCPPVDSYETTS